MPRLYTRVLFGVFVLWLIVICPGCMARFFAAEMGMMRAATGRLAMTEAFTINGTRMVIANDAMLAGSLERLFVRNRVLYIREMGGASRAVGSVTARRTVVIEGQQIILPKDIYALRSGRVNMRSSLGNDAHYKVYQHQESRQLVLKLYEREGYAYVQIGANEFGWILLNDLILVNPAPDKDSPEYIQCKACNHTGHAVQNFKCGLCKGSGHIACMYCEGSKELPCYTCSKSGQLTCATCSGQGFEQCGPCIGRGYILDYFGNKARCIDCDSTGKRECTRCEGNPNRECYECSGYGAITCNQCFGAGFAACYQCYTSGTFNADMQCQKCMGSGWVRIK